MLHIAKLIERRFPQHSNCVAPFLLLAFALVLLIGLGLIAGR